MTRWEEWVLTGLPGGIRPDGSEQVFCQHSAHQHTSPESGNVERWSMDPSTAEARGWPCGCTPVKQTWSRFSLLTKEQRSDRQRPIMLLLNGSRMCPVPGGS